jgi:hypothetical protein
MGQRADRVLIAPGIDNAEPGISPDGRKRTAGPGARRWRSCIYFSDVKLIDLQRELAPGTRRRPLLDQNLAVRFTKN